MKRILFTLTIVGMLLPLAPRVEADAEVSLDFFYDNLSPFGSWIDVADYGYCFQPSVAVDNADWRPYADGYWAYTNVGWTWVSYEDFGWATYHYGRWTDLADYGWVWVPGYEWGPAWVSWRTGGDYVGWAPLPPVSNVVYEGRSITGQVDVLFDIGPLYYNFCDVRYIGEPVLRGRIFAPSRNVAIINQTINVTNITYNNSTVYNYGPNYDRLNQYSARPIQRLTLQRETMSHFGQGGKRGNFNRVNGSQLTVMAPVIQKSPQQIAPKQVKAKVDKPKVEHGWQGVQNRKQLQTEMEEENAKNVVPPSFPPKKGRKDERASPGRTGVLRPNEGKGPARQGQDEATVEKSEERNARRENADPAGRRDENSEPANDQADRPKQRKERVEHQKVGRAKEQQQEREQEARENQQKQQQAEEARNNARRAQQAEQSALDQQRTEQAGHAQRAAKARSQEADGSKVGRAAQPSPEGRRPVRPPQQAQQEQRPNAEDKDKKKKKKPDGDRPQG
jgi:Family of unknown function (DUF6600)